MEKSMKEAKYNLMRRITKLNEQSDWDIIKKLDKSIGMAYDDRTFYIAEIELCDERNNGEIILKTGWTRKTVKERFSDKRNGYKGLYKIHKEYLINPRLAEELNKHINNKFACGKEGANLDFTGKTEMIDREKYTVQEIINECDHFIDVNKYTITGRGKIN